MNNNSIFQKDILMSKSMNSKRTREENYIKEYS